MISNDDAQKLFVAGLPDSVTDVVLRDLFTGAGTQVVDLSIPRDRMTGRPRGFAFVTLSSPDDVERALSMLDGHVLGRAVGWVVAEKDSYGHGHADSQSDP